MSSVITEIKDHVFYIRLNRPEKHNAFNPDMISALTDSFNEASKSQVRAIVLRGEGKSFCSGADLEWMKSMVNYNLEENLQDSKQLFEMFEAGLHCSVPIIGYLHGNVMGGALGLAAICDIVLAEFDTKFCFSEIKIGLAPAVISPFILKKVSPSYAREWMLTGCLFSAEKAKLGGLVTYFGNSEEMNTTLDKVVGRLRKSGPTAVRETKKLLNEVPYLNWRQKKEATARVISERRVSEEGQDGLNSFFSKETPSWKIES